jgi:hypothetical protein
MFFFGKNRCAGLEQEFFLIPRDAFARRLDLQAHILKSTFL